MFPFAALLRSGLLIHSTVAETGAFVQPLLLLTYLHPVHPFQPQGLQGSDPGKQVLLVFNTGTDSKAFFNVGSNSSANLVGSLITGKYKGILLFQDRTVTSVFTHKLGGGGAMGLTGTIYLVNNDKINYPQTLDLQGNVTNNTQVTGEIIVDLLKLGGGGSIVMTLNPTDAYIVRKVALVR